ncbi:MAG: hypothetical protein VX265_10640 [Myxococcota bacterium]|nr:hypothetical protein [Myxococcota bacterium]MEC8422990.1 hypothetical protein [Myxococcota bacterium]
MMLRLLPALTLAAATTGPVHAGSEPLKLTPVGVKDLQLGFGGGSFDLIIEAERLKGLPITLRNLQYELLIGNVVLTETERDYEAVVLRKGEPVEVAIPVTLDASTAMSAGAKALTSGRLDLRIRGTAGLRVWVFPLTVGFDEKLESPRR